MIRLYIYIHKSTFQHSKTYTPVPPHSRRLDDHTQTTTTPHGCTITSNTCTHFARVCEHTQKNMLPHTLKAKGTQPSDLKSPSARETKRTDDGGLRYVDANLCITKYLNDMGIGRERARSRGDMQPCATTTTITTIFIITTTNQQQSTGSRTALLV